MTSPMGSVLGRAWQAALVVLATAVAARVAWELLEPLVPGLLIATFLIGVLSYALSGKRRRL